MSWSQSVVANMLQLRSSIMHAGRFGHHAQDQDLRVAHAHLWQRHDFFDARP